MSDDDVVIWSIEHQRWWKPGELGYCDTLADAGRYPRDRAEQIVRRANLVAFHECAIPVTALAGASEFLDSSAKRRANAPQRVAGGVRR